MKALRDIALLKRIRKPVVLAVGFFDGVHRGHQSVIKTALREAGRRKGAAWALTFDTHPLSVVRAGGGPRLLTAEARRLALLGELGVEGCVLLRFDRKLARMAPVRFARMLEDCVPPLVGIVAGTNWRFGRGGRGSVRILERDSVRTGLRVTEVAPVLWNGRAISSSRIRGCVARGGFREAERMLGRPFGVCGVARRGAGRGRALGFPTANLDVGGAVLPPPGVYAVRAALGEACRGGGCLLDGVANLGFRPTFGHSSASQPLLELHLLGRRMRSMYGRRIEVIFAGKLRDERRFSSKEALAAGIRRDCALARRILAGRNRRPGLR